MSEAHWAELARLLVRRSLDVQPGWQVAVRSTPLGRPLVEECCREIARCGAYALPQIILGFERWTIPLAWAEEAPEELLGTLAPIDATRRKPSTHASRSSRPSGSGRSRR